MSAHPPRVNDSRLLKGRADYFFTTKACARGEVAAFACMLLDHGPAVAIGGFLRDLLLAGNRAFKSDVDFVVDPRSMPAFERAVERLGAKVNKFGGYGIALDRWKVDVWPLERTWAAVNGHVPVATLHDLVDVTFFDWDAVLYSVDEQRLIAKSCYFDRVRRRVIDINLEPNPNPLGNAVRALRYAYKWEAAIGTRLAQHVARQIRDNGWGRMMASERGSFTNPMLADLDGAAIARMLQRCVETGSGPVSLPLAPVQQALPLGDTASVNPPRPARPRPRPAMPRKRPVASASALLAV
ncbi:hypothetical protein PUR23_14400 [Methylorubrum populi]|jgi:hypothetical protein|uniref:Poly A polymerase head domain-containing protein n=2 Tax=Methylobacterium TaxID=407 RepID=A0AAJ1TR65_9HYPH|nr:hypothetical protein [Methylobacterium brachiatum]MCB4802803.1 hypothetical protein [Methylobacterium brachiatum]MDQ0543439.1 hypothetical protein [Methylobacterium brachiatum]